ncbi:MAG TPA: type ISP restriction/modification enzyme [Polyangiales bacterium]
MQTSLPRSLPTTLSAHARTLEHLWTPRPQWFDGVLDTQVQLLVCGLVGLRVMACSAGGFDRALATALAASGPSELDRMLHAALADTQPVALVAELDAVIERLAHPAVAQWLAGCSQPLLELYEPFLRAWHPAQRRSRGVYFTPAPLALYVVDRLDSILIDDLGVPLGLADTGSFRTLGFGSHTPDAFAVRVLDPAAGTGVFLAQVIARVFERMQARHRSQGLDAAQSATAWQRYVAQALLPRLVGFEILPVVAALAELQLGLALAATGYERAATDAPVIHRVDALQVCAAHFTGVPGAAPGLLHDSEPVTVILGNPPYARGGRRKDHAWTALLDAYKETLHEEKNLQPLADDYVRFMRASECLLQRAPFGVAGLVTNATYLDGHLHRGMRASLLRTFSGVEVLDLGGSSKHRAHAEGDGRDENLFGVATGVAATLLWRSQLGAAPRLRYGQLRGRRTDKLRALALGETGGWQALAPEPPAQLLLPARDVPLEYADFVPVDELFTRHSIGAKPGDDAWLVAFDPAHAQQRFQEWQTNAHARPAAPASEAARKARALGSQLQPLATRAYAYRPFDTRSVCEAPQVWTRPVRKLRACIDGEPSLLTTRFARDGAFSHVFATRLLPDVIFLSNKTSVNCFAFPRGALQPSAWGRSAAALSSHDSFSYVYAVLHSRGYRMRYAAGLVAGFPRVPAPPPGPVALALAALGERLLALHLMEASLGDEARPRFVDGGDRRIDRRFALQRALSADATGCVSVPINRVTRFEGVPLACWIFRVGAYQVCHKWLLDRMRAERALSDADILHYQSIVATLAQSLHVMDAIDAQIERHGGWPDALRG